eukprot:8510143-Alexandrium_andersonii.AAC.1
MQHCARAWLRNLWRQRHIDVALHKGAHMLLRTSMNNALRPPGRRRRAPAQPRVATSESSNRTAFKGGVAANIA